MRRNCSACGSSKRQGLQVLTHSHTPCGLSFRRDRVVRVLKLPTAPDDYAFMLAEDYDAAVQHQYQLMQVLLLLFMHTASYCITFAQLCVCNKATTLSS